MKPSGLSFALLLLAALVAAFLVVSQLRTVNVGRGANEEGQGTAVEQARELVEQINGAQQRASEALEP